MKVSKNISKGSQITSIDYLVTLAKERKSVVLEHGSGFWHSIRPAAFIINWPLITITRFKIFHAVKESDAPQNNQ